jgi:hypothetical protein
MRDRVLALLPAVLLLCRLASAATAATAANIAYSQPSVADPFAALKPYAIKGYLTATIHYDPTLTSPLIAKRLTTTEEPLVLRAFKVKLDRTKSEWYFVDYDEGPSADPEFILTREGAKEPAGRISGLDLYLPGNGSIYASGHADTMFDQRQKFVLKAGKIAEIKQPFLYVGIEGKAKKEVTLYTTRGGKERQEIVAVVPKGGAMTVLLADGVDNYLVKTPFGLVGWTHIKGDTQEAQVIDGLFFAGD